MYYLLCFGNLKTKEGRPPGIKYELLFKEVIIDSVRIFKTISRKKANREPKALKNLKVQDNNFDLVQHNIKQYLMVCS